MSATIKGTDAVKARLRELARKYPAALDEELYKVGLRIQAESQELCPVKTNRLRSSAYTAKPEAGRVTVGYGTDYAVFVHERTELHHPNGGQSKFLETAFVHQTQNYHENLASAIEGRVR